MFVSKHLLASNVLYALLASFLALAFAKAFMTASSRDEPETEPRGAPLFSWQ